MRRSFFRTTMPSLEPIFSSFLFLYPFFAKGTILERWRISLMFHMKHFILINQTASIPGFMQEGVVRASGFGL